ncbi:MAG: zinc-dependent alcohol dehydrogenase family protein [Thiohalophilus sp.]|jgi:NADPH2:quinone reductase
MQAVIMTRPGDPSVLQAVEQEEPRLLQPDEIKVQLHAAGINPIDTKLRQRGVFFENALPAILGCDGAGVVVETGEQVDRLQVGDRVWFCHGGLGREQGNYAQYNVVPASVARPLPDEIDFTTAAAGPLVLITAWEALYDRARLQDGQSVLIHAGAGGVGHVAIQLAKLAGARVITTVSDDDKANFVRNLGADEVINYREQELVETVMDLTEGQGVDVAFDTVGPRVLNQTLPAVARYGQLVTLLDPDKEIDWSVARRRNLGVSFEMMLTPMLDELPAARTHQGEILDHCAGYLHSGQIRLHVSQTLPLSDAAEGHRLIEAGHTRGKIVLTTGA